MKYRITDSKSGKTLVISGDAPPSEQEAEQLFSSSGIRGEMTQDNIITNEMVNRGELPQNQQEVYPQQQPSKLQGFSGAMAPIANFLMPNVVKNVQENLQKIGEGNMLPTKPSFQSVAASALGGGAPVGETLLGTPEQKQRQAASREVATTLQGVLGAAGLAQGGVNAISGAIRAKSLSPSRIATATREKMIEGSKADISPDEVKNAFIKAGENASGGIRDKAIKYAASDAERISSNPITTTKGLVEEISKQWGASRSSKGALLTKAQAQYADDARNALMDILKTKDPVVYKQTRKIGSLIKGQELLGKVLKVLVPTAVVGGAIKGIGQ